MFLETPASTLPLSVQLRSVMSELTYSPGETNYVQRRIFVQAKAERLLAEVDALVAEVDAASAAAFFALHDSGQLEEADRAYDALSRPARALVNDEQIVRSERACREM